MFNKVISTIAHVRSAGSFESYVNSLNSRGVAGGPTFEEARKDFRNANFSGFSRM